MSDAPRLSIFMPSLMGGGAERVMVTLANGLAARGYRVDLLLASSEGPYRPLVSSKVRIVDFKRNGIMACLPGLVTYLRRDRPTSLLAVLSHTNVVSLVANRLAGSPARVIISERSSYEAKLPRSRSLKARALRWLMARTYSWASAIVVVAQALGDELVRHFGLDPARIHTIANPVVNADMLERAHEPMEWPFEASGPTILGAGRLTYQKDFATLIRAFAILRRERSARLVIIGEGEDRPQLEALIRELGLDGEVSLPGFKDNPFAFMRRSDLFVLSSRWEGMPGVVVQAMACGTPVICTDCPTGPSELLEGGRWGRLVPVGDPQALAAAMAATLAEERHPDVAQRAAAFGEDRAVESYAAVMLRPPEPASAVRRAGAQLLGAA